MTWHARFAPSAASRWLHCPGSTANMEGYEDESDEYASEGTAMHSLLQHCLEAGLDPIEQHVMGESYCNVRVTLDMAEAVEKVVTGVRNFLINEPYELSLEERVYAPEIHEDCSGTLDIRLWSERKRHLKIIDFKGGAGIEVRAKDNEQLIIYADACITELELMGCDVERVDLIISQPRHRAHEYVFDIWETDVATIKSWRKRFTKAIKDGKTLKAGKWCRLCPKSGNCAVQDAYVGEVMPDVPESQYDAWIVQRTPEQLAVILDRQESINHWFAACFKHAFDMAKLGQEIPGWEIVDISKHRVFLDKDAAEKELHARFGDVIYEEREMRSPAQLEKIKGARGIIQEHTYKPVGGQTLRRIK